MSARSNSHRVKITIDISEDERTYIKMLATKKNMTISKFIMSCIPLSTPNTETQKAMCDVNERKNLTRCNSIEEFLKVLEIDPHA